MKRVAVCPIFFLFNSDCLHCEKEGGETDRSVKEREKKFVFRTLADNRQRTRDIQTVCVCVQSRLQNITHNVRQIKNNMKQKYKIKT